MGCLTGASRQKCSSGRGPSRRSRAGADDYQTRARRNRYPGAFGFGPERLDALPPTCPRRRYQPHRDLQTRVRRLCELNDFRRGSHSSLMPLPNSGLVGWPAQSRSATSRALIGLGPLSWPGGAQSSTSPFHSLCRIQVSQFHCIEAVTLVNSQQTGWGPARLRHSASWVGTFTWKHLCNVRRREVSSWSAT